MINFACKKVDLNEAIRCSLNLTKAEFKILDFFMKNSAKRFESKEIAIELGLELSTVQRSMKKMNEKGIIKRSQINLEKAGYTYAYCLCEKKDIKEIIKQTVNGWMESFEKEIGRW